MILYLAKDEYEKDYYIGRLEYLKNQRNQIIEIDKKAKERFEIFIKEMQWALFPNLVTMVGNMHI